NLVEAQAVGIEMLSQPAFVSFYFPSTFNPTVDHHLLPDPGRLEFSKGSRSLFSEDPPIMLGGPYLTFLFPHQPLLRLRKPLSLSFKRERGFACKGELRFRLWPDPLKPCLNACDQGLTFRRQLLFHHSISPTFFTIPLRRNENAHSSFSFQQPLPFPSIEGV